ncbi:MAG: efflux RND transporter periplasmic adaptor subunit [Parvibaculaceae bacterium]
MSRAGKLALIVVVWAAAIGGYVAGQQGDLLSGITGDVTQAASASGPIIYYRHPDGEPVYSAMPRETDDGRPFTAVSASEDVSFELKPPASETASIASGERRILYYRNPMGLPDTSPVPKKDSMGMDYIPVYEGEDGDSANLTLSAGKIQRTGVKSAVATKQTLQRPVRAPATIAFDERRISVIATRTEAFIEDVADVTTGQRISQGSPLVELYAREVSLAGADLVTNLGSNGPTAGAVQRLKNLGVPESVIEEVRRTGKVPLRIALTAPANGVVLERNAVIGMVAQPGQALFRIADTSRVWALANVTESSLAAIKPGARAVVRMRGLDDQEITGSVELVYPELDAQTRTAKVRIELPNPGGVLRAGMFAYVEIMGGNDGAVVAVPDGAVIDTGDRQLVFIDEGEGRFAPRDVKTGARADGLIEIRVGLSEGERVVTSATFLLDAESNLKAALAGMSAGTEQP